MTEQTLERIATALERLAPPRHPVPDPEMAAAYVWRTGPDRLQPVEDINRIDLDLLVGIDRSRKNLLANTRNFARGLPANNALLWGARGMGKSSLIKAVHGVVATEHPALKLVELHREDLTSLDRLLDILRRFAAPCILFCDDLSFAHDEHHYKSLKAVLDGGVEGRPGNVVFYVTSNRRHLMPRDMIENERSTAINPSEAVEEKVSLSDRFGLWLGFHPCSQDQYLEMVKRYCKAFGLPVDETDRVRGAIEWQQSRGARSGRVAWQYVISLAGEFGMPIPGTTG